MKKFIIFITILSVLIISFAITSSAHCVNYLDPIRLVSPSSSNGGLELVNNYDGTFQVNGTTSSSSFAFITSNNAVLFEKGVYIFFGSDVPGVMINYKMIEDSSFNLSISSGNVIVKTFEEDCHLRGNLIFSAGTYDNVIIKPHVSFYDLQDYGSPETYEDYVEIYKASDDYAAALETSKNEGYIAGETEGFEEGKSEGYKSGKNDGYSLGSQNGELVGYIDGYKAGYDNFNLSTEYRLENEKQYSNGFAAGVESVKQEQRDNTLLILVPSVVVCGLIAITVILIKSKKKKR